VESQTVAVVEEDVMVVITVPVLLKDGWYLILGKFLIEDIWVGYEVIIGYTAILRYFLMVCGS
jgi:hypothetical protein